MKSRLRILIPLVFMTLGLLSLVWGEREFQRRADRDNAELRQDLKEAGISKAEFAALLSAQTKQQANASSFTENNNVCCAHRDDFLDHLKKMVLDMQAGCLICRPETTG